MSKKKKYRVHNWKEYNKGLVSRGSLTVWFDADSIASWENKARTGQRGRPQLYSDLAIQCCLTLKVVFKLPLRATQGFVDSLLQLMHLPLTAPDYSLLSLRQRTLNFKKPNKNPTKGAMHLVVDSTGLKLYGEGEWTMRKHGKTKRRRWLKLHLAVNESEQSIEACVLTADNVLDAKALPHLLTQVEHSVDQVTGDGAYDNHGSYKAAIAIGARPCFPPRVTAARSRATDEAYRLRNHAVSHVKQHSLSDWKKKNNYHQRSLAETAMYRFKQLLGNRVQERKIERQVCEIDIKCLIMNKMTKLGMPLSEMC